MFNDVSGYWYPLSEAAVKNMLYRTNWDFGYSWTDEIKTVWNTDYRCWQPIGTDYSQLHPRTFGDSTWYINIRPDIDSCPVMVGLIPKFHDDGTSYQVPYLKWCKSPSCPRCSSYKASRSEADYSHLYDIGSRESWWFLTFTGGGAETHFRHAPLREQVWYLKDCFNRFLYYMKSNMGVLSIGGNLSYIASVEATVNTRKEMDGPHTSQCTIKCKDEKTGEIMTKPSHWNAHIHAHFYAPQWDDMVRDTSPLNSQGHKQPSFRTSKKGTKIPHKDFRREMQRIAGVCGFGTLDISKLQFDKEDDSKDGVNYIYKSYILKKPPSGAEEWYRRSINHAFQKSPRWWCGGPFYDNVITSRKLKESKKQERSKSTVLLFNDCYSTF